MSVQGCTKRISLPETGWLGFFRDNGVCCLQQADFKKLSPVASFFLLLRQKKETKEKATPDRSKARNKISSLRRWRNSAAANVGDLKHSPA
jgi:hypothetical protein